MFGLLNIGPWELILILIVMLIIFGPGKLPEIAQSLGKAMREFRKAFSSAQQVWDEMIKEEPVKPKEVAEEEVPGTMRDKTINNNESNGAGHPSDKSDETISSDQTDEKKQSEEQHREAEG